MSIKEVIKSGPTINLDISVIEAINECPICLDPFTKDYDYTITKCLHKFHNSCIIKHIHKVNHNCPVCRSELLNITVNINVYETAIRPRYLPDNNMMYQFILQLTGLIKVIVVYIGTLFIVYTIKPNVLDILIKSIFIYLTSVFTNWFFNTIGLVVIISYTLYAFLDSMPSIS